MERNCTVWKECTACKGKCCKDEGAFPLVPIDCDIMRIRSKLKGFDESRFEKAPCPFLDKRGLCSIHGIKPLDCRIFPFDTMKKDGKFFWALGNWDCPILENNNYEPYLQELEKGILPRYSRKELMEFMDGEDEELYAKRFSYRPIREIRMP